MFCRRCQYDLPDGTEVCPVCGTMTRRKARRRNAPLKFLIRYLDILTMLSLLLHAFVWATGAHFVIDGSIGLIDARKYLYLAHKGLSAVDLAFAALIVANIVFSVVMRYKLMREYRIGKLFLIVSLTLCLLWGILYPLAICAMTGALSTMMGLAYVQAAVYAVLAIVPAVILLKSDQLIF